MTQSRGSLVPRVSRALAGVPRRTPFFLKKKKKSLPKERDKCENPTYPITLLLLEESEHSVEIR